MTFGATYGRDGMAARSRTHGLCEHDDPAHSRRLSGGSDSQRELQTRFAPDDLLAHCRLSASSERKLPGLGDPLQRETNCAPGRDLSMTLPRHRKRPALLSSETARASPREHPAPRAKDVEQRCSLEEMHTSRQITSDIGRERGAVPVL